MQNGAVLEVDLEKLRAQIARIDAQKERTESLVAAAGTKINEAKQELQDLLPAFAQAKDSVATIKGSITENDATRDRLLAKRGLLIE